MSEVLFYFLFFLVLSGGYGSSPPPPLPCPSPEDRNNAWYTGGTCSGSYTCCFGEPVLDPISGNFSDMSCCYAYGTGGPYKCCGRSDDKSELLLLLLLIPVIFGIIIGIIYCSIGTCCCKRSVYKNPIPIKSENKNNPTSEPIKSDTSIELENISLDTVIVELED